MSYVDEIYERVVAQNPGEPEFHQAVKEVLDSLMPMRKNTAGKVFLNVSRSRKELYLSGYRG